MISNKFKVGSFTVECKDGYFVIGETVTVKTGDNAGNELKTNVKTYAHKHTALKHLVTNGIGRADGNEALLGAYRDYAAKVSAQYLKDKKRKLEALK